MRAWAEKVEKRGIFASFCSWQNLNHTGAIREVRHICDPHFLKRQQCTDGDMMLTLSTDDAL